MSSLCEISWNFGTHSEHKMMLNGCNDKALYFLWSVLGICCFLAGSVDLETQPAVRNTLVLWVMAEDTCIPLYIVISYDRTLITTMCASMCVRVNHVWVRHSQTEELLVTMSLFLQQQQSLSEFAQRWAWQGRCCSSALQNKQTA